MSHQKPHRYSNRFNDKPWRDRQIRRDIRRNEERDRKRAREDVGRLKPARRKSRPK